MELNTVGTLPTETTNKPAIPDKKRKKYSGKRIGLKQLSQKVYEIIPIQDKELGLLLGDICGAFDIICFGDSGSGKSNLVAKIIRELVLATKEKCDYISYEEGHEASIQKTLITRHNLLENLGTYMGVWDRLTYDELVEVMKKRKSPKIWVIDSIQTSGFTTDQVIELRENFVLSKRQKIIIWVSWSAGNKAKGAVGECVQYNAVIKIHVKGKIAFPISNRLGGNKNYVIWEEGAIKAWGRKEFLKHKKA